METIWINRPLLKGPILAMVIAKAYWAVEELPPEPPVIQQELVYWNPET